MSKLRECLLAWQSARQEGDEPDKDTWEIQDGDETVWNVLAFDGVLEETHSGASTVTSYPIDKGYLISDSSIKQNRQITLRTVTSNMSYKVTVRRKDFDSSFTELVTSIKMAQKDKMKVPATTPIDRVKDLLGLYEEGEGEYPEAIKHGRTKYDNDEITLTTPFGSISTGQLDQFGPIGKLGQGIATTLAAQISSTKVDEVFDLVDDLSAKGVRVHLISMRGVKKDCVITSYSVSNNNTNAHSLPMTIELTQMTVFETKAVDGLLASDTSQNQTSSDAVESQASVNTPRQREVPISPMSYFMAGYEFRSTPLTEAEINQNPVRLTADRIKLGDKRYFDVKHKEIKISTKRDFYLSYKGIDYVFGKIQFNNALNSFTTSLSWSEGGVVKAVGEFPLTVGVNLVSQYATSFESLVAVNIEEAGRKVRDIKHMKLLIIEEYDKYYL